jgi:hypothetical protein
MNTKQRNILLSLLPILLLFGTIEPAKSQSADSLTTSKYQMDVILDSSVLNKVLSDYLYCYQLIKPKPEPEYPSMLFDKYFPENIHLANFVKLSEDSLIITITSVKFRSEVGENGQHLIALKDHFFILYSINQLIFTNSNEFDENQKSVFLDTAFHDKFIEDHYLCILKQDEIHQY